MSADLEALGSGLKGLLKALAKDAGAELRAADVQQYLSDISADVVQYTSLASTGSPRAAANLRHLRAQAALVGGLIKGRVAAKTRDAFIAGVLLVAKTAAVTLEIVAAEHE